MRAALVLAWFVGFFMLAHKASISITTGRLGWDAHAYWLAGRGDLSYSRSPGEIDAYLYSPAFAAIVRPLAALDWPVFYAVWIILQSAALIWLLQPLRRRWCIPIFMMCVPELVNGNIFILLAASGVLGVTRPAVLTFPLLTKITASVGLLWFVARRQWRAVARALSVTALVAAMSYFLAPADWQAWLEFLFFHREGTPDGVVGFVARCLVACGLVVLGARKGWAWLVAPAMVIASPVFDFPVLTILAAVPRLLMHVDGDTNRLEMPEPATR